MRGKGAKESFKVKSILVLHLHLIPASQPSCPALYYCWLLLKHAVIEKNTNELKQMEVLGLDSFLFFSSVVDKGVVSKILGKY